MSMNDFSYPRTAAEWWSLFDENKDAMRSMVLNFHPGVGPLQWAKKNENISAPDAEQFCVKVRAAIAKETVSDPMEDFDHFIVDRNGPAMASLFNSTWFGLPESMGSREVEGFGVLCDLCSESHVFCEGEEQEDEE